MTDVSWYTGVQFSWFAPFLEEEDGVEVVLFDLMHMSFRKTDLRCAKQSHTSQNCGKVINILSNDSYEFKLTCFSNGVKFFHALLGIYSVRLS